MASLLPNGLQQFIGDDGTGAPLSLGLVYFYVPNTLVPKDTWQDGGQTILNTNPVVLDEYGRALIYGSGTYRQIVKDANGNTIWDQLTADTASGGVVWGGVSGGTANAQSLSASSFNQTDGQVLDFIAGFSNTGQLTLTIGGGSPIPVLADTLAGPTPLTGSEVIAQNAYSLIYEASRGAFHLVNPSFSTSAASSRYAVAGGTGNAITGTFSPAFTAYTTGLPFYVKISSANTAGATINANGLGAKTITTITGAALIANLLVVGQIAAFVYDGTNVQLLNPAPVGLVKIGAPTYVTSSGTITFPAGTVYWEAWVIGGGAGGGATVSAATSSSGAGGGGYGGVCFVNSFTVASQSTTIGAGGAGSTSSGSAGTSGGNTVFGGTTANGATGGGSINGASRIIAAGGGAGGTVPGGNQNVTGQPGGAGTAAGTTGNASQSASGGNGGSGPFGTGGIGGHFDTSSSSGVQNGADGSGFGSGGGGGAAVNVGTTANGGAGKAGLVVWQAYGLY